jgi:hypothetical protein
MLPTFKRIGKKLNELQKKNRLGKAKDLINQDNAPNNANYLKKLRNSPRQFKKTM